jgi:hypothetical protein
MIVYFDTNVFDHIFKNLGVTTAEQNAMRRAVSSGKIRIVLSYLNLEEVLTAALKRPSFAFAELRFILEIVDKSLFVKPANVRLVDDIRCYADNKPLLNPFDILNPVNYRELEELTHSIQLTDELSFALTSCQEQKKAFVAAMNDASNEVLSPLKKFLRENHGQPMA